MNTPIRIFVDAHSLDAGYQGAHTFLKGIYTALHQQYPEVQIYFGTENPDQLKSIFPFAEDSHIFLYKKRKLSALRLLIDIPAILKRHSFDYAHFQYLVPLYKYRIKFIVTVHDILFNDFKSQFPWLYRKKRNILFKRSLIASEIRTTVSGYSRERIASHYSIAENKIAILPNAVDRDYGTGMNREEAVQLVKAKYGMENFILCVSRIEPRKNQALLMKIYLDLKLYKKNIPLIFIGGESIPVPSLKKMLDKTGEARSFIHFLQDMPPGDLVSFYSSCRLFIYPSLAEGFGIPPLEAAVCLAPVICSSSTAMRDFEFFGNGLFNPKNERDLSVKISEFLNDPPSITKRTRIAERIKERYSWEKTASLFYHLLMENR